MKIRVKVVQNIKYYEELVADFESMEEATLFCEVVLHACKNTKVEIGLIENYEREDSLND